MYYLVTQIYLYLYLFKFILFGFIILLFCYSVILYTFKPEKNS